MGSDSERVLVRLNIKSSLGRRGDLVYVTAQQLDDLGLYADVLEPGELEYVYQAPSPDDAPVWTADECADVEEWGDI